MPRWLFILAIAVLTWLALTAQERGFPGAALQRVENTEIPEWETAAEHEGTERREDAFQRAWNKSEKRVHAAMAAEGEPE